MAVKLQKTRNEKIPIHNWFLVPVPFSKLNQKGQKNIIKIEL